ncbi:MAG TPA: PEGA domain-containing protein [bacterium]|nr:PEGA domain-containing protein [bacterium]
MSLFRRRILYCIFFLIFFIAAPIVVLLAQGYQYDFTKRRLEKTGVLFLESKPSKATIYLNYKIQKDTTESRLKNLLPNDYDVKITKDGYQDWQKKLTVHPNETTFAQYIRLFKKEPKVANIFSQPINIISALIDNLIALNYTANNKSQLALFNLDTESISPLAELNFVPEKLMISSRQNYLLASRAEKIVVIDLINKKIIDLSQQIRPINSPNWSLADKDEMLYFTSSSGLFKINLTTQNISTVINEPIIAWTLIDKELYYLSQEKTNVALKKMRLGLIATEETLNSFPTSKYTLENLNADYLFLLDTTNNIFYLLNLKDSTEKIKTFAETKYFKISADNNILLLGNDFEIFNYDLNTKEENIILRLSSEIIKSAWYPVSTHIYYLSADGLKITETIKQDKILNNLITGSDIKDFFGNADGNKVYYIDENGLNVAEIQ